ncbi:hypothetical protein M673_15935 [Aureimonas sp. AU20]|nr:hypothetical protein M673_15935 [Aureimonas sp. AU20]
MLQALSIHRGLEPGLRAGLFFAPAAPPAFLPESVSRSRLSCVMRQAMRAEDAF